ncbi:AI-2E family transporter [Paenibacillus aurantius]|uniref:AI-2E family transporter n=1 Tax=Paenibacillus aurantius TaxID=2918900 RepID=A0AA96LFX0_9BACL|nr:AI-2E family transporter [Paenibacillus aurantius]WNQ13314.1 AI-2E family transporter [Paenibacillus aurantius]
MVTDRFLRICLRIIAVMLIVYLLHLIAFVFHPIGVIIGLVIAPFVISGFFYYLLRPVIRYMDNRNMNRTVSVLLIYFAIAVVLAILSMVVWPTLRQQVLDFVANGPELIKGIKSQLSQWGKDSFMSELFPDSGGLTGRISAYLSRAVSWVTDYSNRLFSFVTGFFIIIGTCPLILYYMLKEGEKLTEKILLVLPVRFRGEAGDMMEEIDTALSGYIAGRMLSTLFLAIITFVGFLLVGLPYSLLLAILASVFTFIPYVGVVIGAIPPLIVAWIDSPHMVLWVLLVLLIAQQIQDHLLAPLIFGKKLEIHPLTTIFLLLVAGDFGGIIGMFLAIPLYMVAKIVTIRIYRLFFAEKVQEIQEET